MLKKSLFIQGMAIAALVFALDMASKQAVLEHDLLARAARPITSFFNLVLVMNRGISFGLFGDSRNTALVWAFIASAIAVVLCVWLTKTGSRQAAWALGLVIGGAAGNVSDRLRFGAVVDFLDFHVAGLHWPAFNIADAAITTGVLLLCLESFRSGPERNQH